MNAQLLKVIARARCTPFYSARSLPAVWESMPVTTKEDLRGAYPFGLLAVPMRQVSSYHESSGTSGQPISSLFTDRDWEDIVTRFLRNEVGLNSNDMVLVKTPYALVTTAHQMHQAARFAGATVVPADNRSSNMPYTRVIRLLRDLPITVAWCMPTEALIWAYVAREMGLSPERDFPHLRAFLVAGEALSPAKKKMLSELWGGKKVFEDYGSTETGSLAGECANGKMHLWTDRILFEVRDEQSGEIRTTGSGTLLVTPLNREAMPLVRYELGDQAAISLDPCPCGSTFPTVEIAGRQGTAITVGEAAISARELENLVYHDYAQTQILFWRARPSTDGGKLLIEIFSPSNKATESLRESIAREFGVCVEVQLVPANRFVPDYKLADEAAMQKPRFLFSADEDWNKSLSYA